MSKQKKPRKSKKEPLAFWQKSPEIKAITDHIGKFVDNLKPDGLVNLALYGSLAYLSYKAFGITKRIVTETIQVPHKGTRVIGITTPPSEERWPLWGISPWDIEAYTKALESVGIPQIGQTTWKTEEYTYYTTETVTHEVEESHPTAALIGPVALKLATTMGGTPPIAQISGLATLVYLGLATGIPELADIIKVDVTGVPRIVSGLGPFGTGHLGVGILPGLFG